MLRWDFVFGLFVSLVILACAEPNLPVAPQSGIRDADGKEYQSPFSGYEISLDKLTELSRMTFEQAVDHLEKNEGVYVFRLGTDHPKLSERDERLLQKALEAGKGDAEYFAAGKRLNTGLTVKQPTLAERDDSARAVIVIKPQERGIWVLAHEYGHHLFLNGRKERAVKRNGKDYDLRDALLEEAVDFTLQAAAVLKKALADKDNSKETVLLYSKLYVKAQLVDMRNKVVSRRDELDILSLQLRHYRELGTSGAELVQIESYYQKQIELLKETLQYFGEQDTVLIRLRGIKSDWDKELTDLYDQLRNAAQEGADLGSAASRFYREWSK